MYWKVTCEECGPTALEQVDGQFVLQRHVDAMGPHLDLRLEQDGSLVGWRIDGESLDGEPWATLKGHHPLSWLEHRGDARPVDAGVYSWLECGPENRVLALQGREGVRRVRVEPAANVPVSMVRAVCEALRAAGMGLDEAGRLVVDGVAARRRAIERLCGLGRELDGATFDDGTWRRLLAGLDLEEIHGQLRAFEVRFDQKYPPQPVSRPERLSEPELEVSVRGERAGSALSIVREQ